MILATSIDPPYTSDAAAADHAILETCEKVHISHLSSRVASCDVCATISQELWVLNRNVGGVMELVQIAPECPVCRTHHELTFTQEELGERLKEPVVELYCNRFDQTWPATEQDREKLARILRTFQRGFREKSVAV